jgi:hypothetical protein
MSMLELLPLLGANATDEGLVALLERLGVRRRPQQPSPFKSPYEVLFRLSSHGLCLSFQDRAYLENRSPRSWGKSDLQLCGVTVTSGVEGQFRPYAGDIPHGISFADTRDQVRARMARYADTLHAYRRDCWWLGERYISVTYQPGDITVPEQSGIFDLTIGLFYPPSAELVPLARYPDCDELIALFGASMHSVEFKRAFASFDLETWPQESEDGHLDRRRAFGFELHFDRDRPAADGTPSFVGITMTRDRLGPSREWKGTLPFGLDFNDSPEVLTTKIAAVASERDDSMVVWGSAKWMLPRMQMRVNYDTVRNCLESVALRRLDACG